MGCERYLTETPLLVPAFDALLRGEPAPDGVVELTRDSLGSCFVHATRALAGERMTVLLIEDLHFAPEEARTLFTALGQAVAAHRVLLVGTMRPGVSEDWVANLSRLDHCARVDVERLGPKDLGRLLEDSFSSRDLAHSLGMQIAMKSDGNPFFAFEIIRGLREGQLITQRRDGSWASTGAIEEIQVPSSVLDLVNARVAGLSEEERDLLDVACCWGHEFDPGLIGDVLGIGRIPLLKRFGHIERKHRLVRSSGRNYVFDHHQVQEALYGRMHVQMREEYHAALAQTLETRTGAAERDPDELDGSLCVDLCEQYLAGGRGDPAVRYLGAASEHLTGGYLHAQAASLLERGLAIPSSLDGVERASELLRLSIVLDSLGRRERQEEAAKQALQLSEDAGDDESWGEAALALGGLYARISRLEDAEQILRSATEAARKTEDRALEAAAMGGLGTVVSALGRPTEALECHGRHLEISREEGRALGEAMALGNIGSTLRLLGRVPESMECAQRYLEISRSIGYRPGEANAECGLGNALLSLGRLSEALSHHERHLALSREIGERQSEAIATGNVGNILHLLGRGAEARVYLERHLELAREVGFRQGEAIAQHNLGSSLREEGENAAGIAMFEACLATCAAIGFRHLEAATLCALGSLLVSEGDIARGAESLERALDLAKRVQAVDYETLARCELALLPGRDAADALAALTEHRHALDDTQLRGVLHLVWRATGDRTHLEEAKRLVDEAVAQVDAEDRRRMCREVSDNREILEAWAEELGGDDDTSRDSEFVTRAG
jgi:tetratricopeptide (TPR) repeat protein